jgi:hypothetical protein
VGDLVRLDGGDPLLGSEAALLVEQQDGRPSGDETPTFHRSGVKVVSDERVELGEREGNVEDLLVDGHGSFGDVEGVVDLVDDLVGLEGGNEGGEDRTEEGEEKREKEVG